MKMICIDSDGSPLVKEQVYEVRSYQSRHNKTGKYYEVLINGEWNKGWAVERFKIFEHNTEPKNNMNPLEQSIIDIVREHFNLTLDDTKVKSLVEEMLKDYHDKSEDKLKADIQEWIQFHVAGKFPTIDYVHGKIEACLKDVDARLANFKPAGGGITTIKIEEITKEEGTKTTELDVSGLHSNAPALVQFVAAKLNVYLFGPTGSSKTNVCFRIAEMLKMPIQSCTVSPQTPKSELMGYKDANGNYQEGVCYKPFTEGGILLINELDNGNAASNAVLNQLQDEEVFFPCGMRKRHKDFVLIATANTLGNGANRQYVGRSPQDKALLNRFVYLHWPWDKKLEARLAYEEYNRWGGKDDKEVKDTLESFWRLRQAAEELNIDHIISMRNLLQFIRLKATGVAHDIASRATIFRGLDKEQGTKLVAKARTIILESDDSILDGKALGWSNEDTAKTFSKAQPKEKTVPF